MNGWPPGRAGSGPARAPAGGTVPRPPWETEGAPAPPAPWEIPGRSGDPPSGPGTGGPRQGGPAPSAPDGRPDRKRPIAVALLLAAAAVAAAGVGFRASSLAGEGSGKWQSAVRLEVKRSTSAQETVRFLYNVEVPLAITIMRARFVLAELEAIPVGSGPEYVPIAIEKSVQAEILKALEPSSDLTGAEYALDGGGVDLGKRLADLRAEIPDDLKIDPDVVQAAGDAQADKAIRMSLALVLFGLCGFLGAMAQAFERFRLPLLQAGGGALATGLVLAAAVEVLL